MFNIFSKKLKKIVFKEHLYPQSSQIFSAISKILSFFLRLNKIHFSVQQNLSFMCKVSNYEIIFETTAMKEFTQKKID